MNSGLFLLLYIIRLEGKSVCGRFIRFLLLTEGMLVLQTDH